MKKLHSVRWLMVGLGLLIVAAGAFAQTPKPEEYQPQVGQAGKDVVWVPTQQVLVDKMLDMAKMTPNDYVIDLGSGDGRTVITAAKRGATAIGIEYNPEMVELSKRNAANEGVSKRTTFIKADLFETDFSKASVLTLFLLPDINLRLRPKILDMKPGTRVVSNSFKMGEWEPDQEAHVEGECTSWCTAFLWIVPAKVQGKWKLPDGEISFTQEFQKITGTLTSGGKSTAITGKLNGTQIEFKTEKAEYKGQIVGDSVSGTAKSGSVSSDWKATRIK
jgi:hypothetical protein